MLLFAGVVFAFSLIALTVLFSLKLHEMRTGRFIAPQLRAAADLEAMRMKELLGAAQLDVKKVPSIVLYWSHVLIRAAALRFAQTTRTASRRAHQLADLVSHKHHFQYRQTRSEFLRKVSLGKQLVHGQEAESQVKF